MSRKEAITQTLDDVGEMLGTVLKFLESDSAHLEEMGVQEEVGEFPWEARERAVTEMMFALEGLRSRIERI